MKKKVSFFGRKEKGGALAGVVAAGVAGSMLLAPAALAAPGPANIDPAAEGSITVHKYIIPDNWVPGENDKGTELPSSTTDAWAYLNDVEFTVVQVLTLDGKDVNLGTAEGWDLLDGVTAGDLMTTPVEPEGPGDPASPIPTFGTAKTADTVDGKATFNNLPVGLYLVQESDHTRATDADGKDVAVTSGILPFLVTIPVSQTDGTWNYNANVYPKNAVATFSKTVEDYAHKAIGDDIVWTMEGSVPALGSKTAHTKFEMTDTLPAEVSYKSSEVFFGDQKANSTWFSVDSSKAPVITMSLTAEGLSEISKADTTVEAITWDLTTTVNALAPEGILKNEAHLVVNDSRPIPGEAEQEWGGVKVLKYGEGDEAKTLAGAEFQIFGSAADAAAKTNPIDVDGKKTFVSDDNGILLISGLQIGDYWIVETKAPAGYVIDDTPHQITVVAGDNTANFPFVELKVDNAQQPTNPLPPTGAAGVVILSILGVGFLSVGVLAYRKSRQATQA